MKISNNNLLTTYKELNPRSNSWSDFASAKSGEKKFDAVSIRSTPRQIAEKTFVASVSRELSAQVAVTASEDKLQQLKEQISSHTYQIDTSAIASKMLLTKEDV